MFKPTKESALEAIERFLPSAGEAYARSRNFDNGPDRASSVSQLSPWIRLRLISEWKLIEKVLEVHSPKAAGKFIDEVCWRTYWKGWLYLRPYVWTDYCFDTSKATEAYAANVAYTDALAGKTGIDAFDSWTHELIETNYLHNHARMWYASIWIHTLKLPWELGAQFFLRHLLDGDAASNTLSWRWVAGLHTAGKAYVATPENIAHYTNSRFKVTQSLADEPIPISFEGHRAIRPISPSPEAQFDAHTGRILHDDDLSAKEWLLGAHNSLPTIGFFPQSAYSAHRISNRVVDFRKACMVNTLSPSIETMYAVESLVAWAKAEGLKRIVMAEPQIGLLSDALPLLETSLKREGIQLILIRHWWDDHFFPEARAGFFRFKKAIPSAIEQLKTQPIS